MLKGILENVGPELDVLEVEDSNLVYPKSKLQQNSTQNDSWGADHHTVGDIFHAIICAPRLSLSASIQKRLKKEKKAKRKLQEALEFESKRRERVEDALKHSSSSSPSPEPLHAANNNNNGTTGCLLVCLLPVVLSFCPSASHLTALSVFLKSFIARLVFLNFYLFYLSFEVE